MSRPVLLDTHALVWWVSDPARLSAAAAHAVNDAAAIWVSAASAWEIALLVDGRRLELDRPVATWLHDVVTDERVRVAPVGVGVAVAAVGLGRRGFHRDPADRFLYATAVERRLGFVSKDTAIRAFAEADGSVSVIW